MNGSETEAKAVAVLFSESIYVVTTEWEEEAGRTVVLNYNLLMMMFALTAGGLKAHTSIS